MDSFFTTIARHVCLMLQVIFPVTLVWEAIISFIMHATRPWRDLFWFCVDMYLNIWTGIGSLSMKFLVLPLRIYNAIQKEDVIERQMQEMQEQILGTEKRNRELESKLEQLVSDCKHYEELLKITEGEKKVILRKYQAAQLRVLDLQEENETLKAWEEKITKGIRAGKRAVSLPQLKDKIGLNIPLTYEVGMDSPSQPREETILKGVHDDVHHVEAPIVSSVGSMQLNSKQKHGVDRIHLGKHVFSERAIQEGREAALSSSLFSVFLSLLVGTVAWQAQDPCTPLVMAVFMVVCLSLVTVVQFLWSIGSGPGFDAVVLLSCNWFILGTLIYPVLPTIARVFAPLITKIWQWFLKLIGIDYIAGKLSNL